METEGFDHAILDVFEMVWVATCSYKKRDARNFGDSLEDIRELGEDANHVWQKLRKDTHYYQVCHKNDFDRSKLVEVALLNVLKTNLLSHESTSGLLESKRGVLTKTYKVHKKYLSSLRINRNKS